MTLQSFLKTRARRTNDKLGKQLYKDWEPQDMCSTGTEKFKAADFGSRFRNANKHQSQDLNKCNCLQIKSKSEWIELSAKFGQTSVNFKKEKYPY